MMVPIASQPNPLPAGGERERAAIVARAPERLPRAPNLDLRAVLKGVLKDHLRLDEEALASLVFPGSRLAKPMPGLVASA